MKCRQCGQRLFAAPTLAELSNLRPLMMPTMCSQCQALFTKIDQTHCCQDCGRDQVDGVCRDCQRWRKLSAREHAGAIAGDDVAEPVLLNRGIFTYSPAMKEWVERYKGIGDYNLHDCFNPEVSALRRMRRCAFVPLTTEAKHFARRGFDPVVGLFGVLPLKMWLRKENTAVAQAQKNRAARLRTPQSFMCIGEQAAMARYPQICLLDDLYTTGTTMHHAAAAIRAAGYQGTIISRSLIR